jgi:Mce-associated membrane protein
VTVKTDEDVKSDKDVKSDDELLTGVEVEDTPDDVAATAEETVAAPPDRPVGRGRRWRQGAARFWVAIVLVVAVAASAGVTTFLYVNEYLPDRATGPAASEAALVAAKDGTVALLSYAPETLNEDFSNAKTHLTGDFLNYYNQFTEQIVTPAATKKAVKTTAAIVNAAVAELHADSAVVLVFLNQTTTSTENPDGSFSTSAVKVGLKKVNDAWLISSFDPV